MFSVIVCFLYIVGGRYDYDVAKYLVLLIGMNNLNCGNLMFLSYIPLTKAPQPSLTFFSFKKKKYKDKTTIFY